jgi:hypothetical protein
MNLKINRLWKKHTRTHTDKPSILFYLNSTLRLEFSTVERKQTNTSTSLMMIILKKEIGI